MQCWNYLEGFAIRCPPVFRSTDPTNIRYQTATPPPCPYLRRKQKKKKRKKKKEKKKGGGGGRGGGGYALNVTGERTNWEGNNSS